jgi:hypothetical protein
MIRVKISVETELNPRVDSKKQPKPVLEYSVGKDKNKLVELNEKSYIISIPKEQLVQAKPILFTSIKYNKEVRYLNLDLPEVQSREIQIRFFPEGGNLTEGLESTVSWEAKTAYDLPVKLSGILFENDRPIDTVTNNRYGIGKFRLKPDKMARYTIKVAGNSYLKNDTAYELPKTVDNGISLRIDNAVINDTLQIHLCSKERKQVQVLVHNFREAFASFMVDVLPSGTNVLIALPAITKGLATVTVIDDQLRPLAERLFFARYNQKVITSIHPDKPVYPRKADVKVKVQMAYSNGKPTRGIVSVAVVQDNRIQSNKQQDIESYTFLKHELGTLPERFSESVMTDKIYLEDILLVRGWRRYTWQDFVNSKETDTVAIQSPSFTAQVRLNDRLLKKPVPLRIMTDSIFHLIDAEPDGSCRLKPEHLLVTEGRKVWIAVNKKVSDGYSIKLNEPFKQRNDSLARRFEIANPGRLSAVQTTSDQELAGINKSVALKTVVITATKAQTDNTASGTDAWLGSNACGDYVCRHGILNCRNHTTEPDNTHPVEGRRYQGGVYKGCIMEEKNQQFVFPVKGIYKSRAFYGVNMDRYGQTELQYLSTLFWKPGVISTQNGDVEFSFYTGDSTGKFRIIVQGAAEKDVIFGEATFDVK